jgi:hypothetical protein
VSGAARGGSIRIRRPDNGVRFEAQTDAPAKEMPGTDLQAVTQLGGQAHFRKDCKMSSLWTSSDNGTVLVASSPDGVNWTDGTGLVSSFVRLGAGASLAGFYNGVDTQLYSAFVAGNNSPGVDRGAVLVSNSPDGVNWTGNSFRASDGGPTQGYTSIGQLSATAPSLAVF